MQEIFETNETKQFKQTIQTQTETKKINDIHNRFSARSIIGKSI